MNPESTEQDNQVAKNFIKRDEIQKGDLIKVSQYYANGTKVTRRGVAHTQSGATNFSWKDDNGIWLMGTNTADRVTVELINRPKPRVSVPNKTGAVVSYVRRYGQTRTAVRGDSGWNIYSTESGVRMDGKSDYGLEALFEAGTARDLTVIFPGVGA